MSQWDTLIQTLHCSRRIISISGWRWSAGSSASVLWEVSNRPCVDVGRCNAGRLFTRSFDAIRQRRHAEPSKITSGKSDLSFSPDRARFPACSKRPRRHFSYHIVCRSVASAWCYDVTGPTPGRSGRGAEGRSVCLSSQAGCVSVSWAVCAARNDNLCRETDVARCLWFLPAYYVSNCCTECPFNRRCIPYCIHAVIVFACHNISKLA